MRIIHDLHTCPPVVSASFPRCTSLQSVPLILIIDIVTLKIINNYKKIICFSLLM